MRKALLDYYKGTPYNEKIRRGLPARIKDLNIPIIVKRIIELPSFDIRELQRKSKEKVLEITEHEIEIFRVSLIQESLFAFYKAFYNYLAVLKLYSGCLDHWSKVTNYYSMFFLAKSLTTLLGKQEYYITPQNNYYSKKISKILERAGKFYKLKIHLNLQERKGYVALSGQGVNSHKSVWKLYNGIDHQSIGIYDLFSVPKGLSLENINNYYSNQRNAENYSFNGYRQLDFNLSTENFEQYYERSYLKKNSEYICDENLFPTVELFSDLFALFKEFDINNLPIEKEKFIFMAKEALCGMPVLEKLIDWINDDFAKDSPILNLYIEESGMFD